MQAIFQIQTAVGFLKQQIQANQGVHRYKTLLSQAAGCQLSYLSQILAGKVHLNPDQAVGLCSFWKLSSLESEYFLELVHLARAGTARLREVTRQRLEKLRKESERLSARVPQIEAGAQPATAYYSAWYYTAIHILLSIPGFEKETALADRLGIPVDRVRQALGTLESLTLVQRKEKGWVLSNPSVHIPRESPLHELNHAHWRWKSIEAVQKHRDRVSYTGIHSLSRADVEVLKEYALEFLARSRALIEDSPPEQMVCLNCDLFSV